MKTGTKYACYAVAVVLAGATTALAIRKVAELYREADLSAAIFPGGEETARKFRKMNGNYPRSTRTNDTFEPSYSM